MAKGIIRWAGESPQEKAFNQKLSLESAAVLPKAPPEATLLPCGSHILRSPGAGPCILLVVDQPG